MKVISQPKYQSFTGETFRIAQTAKRADDEYREYIFRELGKLKKYCYDNACADCPFRDDRDNCEIMAYTSGDAPFDWRDLE